jgi:hypothetical protein
VRQKTAESPEKSLLGLSKGQNSSKTGRFRTLPIEFAQIA